jgi:ATP-dependent Clp protease ATP-binding subunit ClpC
MRGPGEPRRGADVASHDEYEDVDVLVREGRDLLEDAKTHARVFGRDVEVEALQLALAAGTSVVLLGPPGVGKTAVVRKLLADIARGATPGLGDVSVFEISTAGLCAGTRYTGMQEGKIKALLRHARRERLVYVPDLWNIPTAGSYEGNPRGIYDLMRPGIEAQKLVLFGEMSPGRWEKLCREHPSLERDFATITIDEMPEAETREVLTRTAQDLSDRVLFDKVAIDRIYALAKKFLPTQSFPGKAVDLLRRVAHAARSPLAADSPAGRGAPVDVAFVEELFAKETGLPMHMISPRVQVTYGQMRDFLAERVLGQREAVEAVADVLALYKTGLANPDRPAGVLLFVGPTGVGKTELAKATAEFLFGSRDRIFRIDVSEYKDYHSFEKLIGDPKQNKTGLLTDHVRHNPFSVVLLDEFEKGHANLADLFLQVFDDGRLTDATGETVGFRHALIILTSNVGAEPPEAAIGFADPPRDDEKQAGARVRRALEAHYRPEFLNRIDRILVLRPLSLDDMRQIARRELGKVYEREGLLDRDLLLEVDDGVIGLLLERGFDPKYGARPLKRAIEEHIVVPLARALLGVAPRRFQLLRMARAGDRVSLTFEDTDASRRLDNLDRRNRADDGEGGVVRLSLSEVQKRLPEIYERLSALESAADVPAMRRELAEMSVEDVGPGLWEEAYGPEGRLVRRHQLTVELRRLEDLRRRADSVRELVAASFEEAEDSVAEDLTAAFVRLDRKLSRAELEMVHFSASDQGAALVWIRSVGGKAAAESWVESLAGMYEGWAKERGYEVERSSRGGDVLLTISGPYAYGYLKGEHGGHRLISPPAGKSRRGETFLARVDVTPAEGEDPSLHLPEVREDDPPIRTYDLWRSRGVRDRRTGCADGDVRKVLSGRLDAFLSAAIEESGRAASPAVAPASRV